MTRRGCAHAIIGAVIAVAGLALAVCAAFEVVKPWLSLVGMAGFLIGLAMVAVLAEDVDGPSYYGD